MILKSADGNDLLFHQSGGCCDGSAPMCFPAKEYQVGNSDIKLGEIDGTPFYMNEDQYELGTYRSGIDARTWYGWNVFIR